MAIFWSGALNYCTPAPNAASGLGIRRVNTSQKSKENFEPISAPLHRVAGIYFCEKWPRKSSFMAPKLATLVFRRASSHGTLSTGYILVSSVVHWFPGPRSGDIMGSLLKSVRNVTFEKYESWPFFGPGH